MKREPQKGELSEKRMVFLLEKQAYSTKAKRLWDHRLRKEIAKGRGKDGTGGKKSVQTSRLDPVPGIVIWHNKRKIWGKD